jgi:hypothetical protein
MVRPAGLFSYTNTEFLELLGTYYSVRRERDAGLDGVDFNIRGV